MAELIHIVTVGLILGGHETTKAALSNGLWHLLIERTRWESLKADPKNITAVVEECLRIEPPQNGFYRVVAKDVELSGVALSPGDKIFWLSSSANHDERRFSTPDVFSVDRDRSAPLLTFGQGAHYCIGAPLARTEMRIAFTELARRLPDLELDGDTPFLRDAPVLRHLKSMPVRW